MLFSLGAISLFLAACGDGKSDAAEKIAAVADSARMANSVDLGQYQLPLMLEVPEGTPAPSMVWKDQTGLLEIRAGDRFAFTISEAPADMERLKADLDRDLVKKNTIMKDTPELLIYRSEFPDDTTLVFIHFQAAVQAAGRSFVLQDVRNDAAFTMEDVERMVGSVHAKQAL